MTPPGLAVELATWRPLEVVDVDGWQVGRTAGFTRRANSVAALRAPADVPAALDRVETLYAEQGLPCVVRVCRDSAPADLDDRLADRGYASVAPTQVRARRLDELPEPEAAGPPDAAFGVQVRSRPDESWLRCWLGVKAAGDGPGGHLAARLLEGTPGAYLAVVHDGAPPTEEPVAVIRAARHADWVGLSCLVVAASARRQGLGTVLTIAALRWARADGASRAFLQVEASNDPAVRLYQGLGFAVVDSYHYRER